MKLKVQHLHPDPMLRAMARQRRVTLVRTCDELLCPSISLIVQRLLLRFQRDSSDAPHAAARR
jgi:hypothetical protein